MEHQTVEVAADKVELLADAGDQLARELLVREMQAVLV
jgi:hypothetical protein